MTAFGYLLLLAAVVLVWAGVTDQNPVTAVQAVLSGGAKKGKKS